MTKSIDEMIADGEVSTFNPINGDYKTRTDQSNKARPLTDQWTYTDLANYRVNEAKKYLRQCEHNLAIIDAKESLQNILNSMPSKLFWERNFIGNTSFLATLSYNAENGTFEVR